MLVLRRKSTEQGFRLCSPKSLQEIKADLPGFEPGSEAPEALIDVSITPVKCNNLDEYIGFRQVEGLSDKWIDYIRRFITNYLDYIDWKISKKKTLEYLNLIQKKYSITAYRKRTYQIRRLLTFLRLDWSKDINPPPEPHYSPKRITHEYIENTLSYFKEHRYFKQIKAIIYLGATSGIRAEELYQLTIDDIELDNRMVYVNHNPNNGQSTKTKTSRISFINEEAKQSIEDYMQFHKSYNKLKCLFNQSHISRIFKDAPIQVKDLRKFFSQEWDRRGGPTSIKKILMGHSLRNDVDLMHYNAQSEEDLKKIYDKVMGSFKIKHISDNSL